MKNIRLSRTEFINQVSKKILPAEVVLDIGCGIRPQTFIKPKVHICSDPHKEYISTLQKSLKYLAGENVEEDFQMNEFCTLSEEISSNYIFLNLNWENTIEAFADNSVDTVFILDVIEHLEKEEGKRLLKLTERIAKKQIIIFTPLGFVKQEHDDSKDAWGLNGGELQKHKSGWTIDDFDKSWEIFTCDEFHTHDNLGNKYEKPEGALFAIKNLDSSKSLKKEPFFSVIIPTYNQADYLKEALDSLIKQTFKDWEAVVINDGSTDNTQSVMEEYSAKDSRLKIFSKENGGVASALNEGLKNAKGEWICWLSSDDLFEPDKLETHLQEIKNYPEIKFFYSHWYYLNDKTGEKSKPDLWGPIPKRELQVARFFTGNYVHGNSVAVHKSVFNEVGFFDEELRQAQDFDMWLRISAKYESHFIDKRTCVTRFHDAQVTNEFPAGCYYDSAWSAIKFLNEHTFEEIFPLIDLNEEKNAKLALFEVLSNSINMDAFIHSCGFIPAFIDKAKDWLRNRCSKEYQKKIDNYLEYLFGENNFTFLLKPTQKSIESLLTQKSFTYQKYDFVSGVITTSRQILSQGLQDEVGKLEKYIVNVTDIINRRRGENEKKIDFKPVLFKKRKNLNSEKLDYNKLSLWRIEPLHYNGTLSHTLHVKCPKCDNSFKYLTKQKVKSTEQKLQFTCPNCSNSYFVVDGEIGKYLEAQSLKPVQNNESNQNGKPKVVFLTRGIEGKSGGTVVVAKYINWLHKLGCNVATYADTKKPTWTKLEGEFRKIDNYEDADLTDADLVVLYCIFELPKIISRVDLSKIVYLNQAYEGHLYGENYTELRSHKPLFSSIFSLPIKNITVSKHLDELFKNKINLNTNYIPNGIDHSVFKPIANVEKIKNSILFVGSPFYPLKGFEYLIQSIFLLRQRDLFHNKIKLFVLTGTSLLSDKIKMQELLKLQEQLNIEIIFRTGLSGTEMSELINSVQLYVCASWYEGFSLTAMEVMSCGTPVISTRNMGGESYCIDGYNSILVNFGDKKRLSDSILKIFRGGIFVEELIKNGLDTSLEYSETNSFNYFVEEYSKLLHVSFDKNIIQQIRNGIENVESLKEIRSKNIKKIEPTDIIKWNYNFSQKGLLHSLNIKCPECGDESKIEAELELLENPQKQILKCSKCSKELLFDEELASSFFTSSPTVNLKNPKSPRDSNRVAFLMRYTNVISGGIKVAYQYVEWLAKLGLNVVIYSTAPKPNWIELSCEFYEVKDFDDVKVSDFGSVIVYSVFDVPAAISKFGSEQVYHLSQGYEGYHFGKDYFELRKDKYFINLLHSLPIKKIVISKHLNELFNSKYEPETFCIQNGVDLNCFYPVPDNSKELNSILFVGNPNNLLKGIDFLIKAIAYLQSSQEKLENIKLYIVNGGANSNKVNLLKELPGIEIVYKTDLTSEEMSKLMNKVSLVVNTSWYEGFTLPVLEAMACGTPTIATNNMGAESFCRDNDNSFLVPYGEVYKLKDRILDVLTERVDVEKIVRNGLKTAYEYSSYNSVQKFIKTFEKIVGKSFDDTRKNLLFERNKYDEEYIDKLLEDKILINRELRSGQINDSLKVSIILVTYNQIKYTKECIESIKKHTNVDYEIIVVDNNSSDSTVAELKKDKAITLIQNKENLGFPNAVNIALTEATGNYFLLLNNDVVVTDGWLENMLKVINKDSGIGIVGPVSNIVSGVQLDTNAKYNTLEEMNKYSADLQKKNGDKHFEFPRVAFLCTLIKKELIEKIGGLDERFSPGNFEDDDFCLRAQLSGFKTVIAEGVFIHHYGSKSFTAEGAEKYQQRLDENKKKFVNKWGADPEEIWLKGKDFKRCPVKISIATDLFVKYFERAMTLLEGKEYSLCLDNLERCLEFEQGSKKKGYEEISRGDVLSLAGNISLLLNDFVKAEEFFKTELEFNPNSARACFGLGEVYLNAEVYESAKVMFEYAKEFNPGDDNVVNKLAFVNEKLGLEPEHSSLKEETAVKEG